MTTVRHLRDLALLLAAGAVLSACTSGGTSGGSNEKGNTPPPTPSPTSPTPAPSTPSGNDDRIEIVVNGTVTLTASLRNTVAARELRELLPLTLTMREHGGVEKTGALPEALTTTGAPRGADPEVGDLGYYAPGKDLVLYYGDQSYYDGIVILGRLDGDAAQRIADVGGAISVTVARLND